MTLTNCPECKEENLAPNEDGSLTCLNCGWTFQVRKVAPPRKTAEEELVDKLHHVLKQEVQGLTLKLTNGSHVSMIWENAAMPEDLKEEDLLRWKKVLMLNFGTLVCVTFTHKIKDMWFGEE